MKKLLLLLSAVGMIFTACEGSDGVEEDNGGTPFVPEITISPKDLTFGCNGGEQAVDITANFEYEFAERASWVTVEQTDEGLLVIVDANKNTSERSAFISITNSQYDINKSIEVYQEGYIPKIELAQQSVEVEVEPAEYEVAVTSPYSWEATSKNDWIIVDTPNGIAGTKMLKFSVVRNEEEDIRESTIVVKNEDYNLVAELYVIQKTFVPAITIEPETLAFAVEGGTKEVAVTANIEYEASADADWLTIEKSEKGVSVTVPNYVEVDERTAEITISNEKYGVSKVVNVTQGAFVPAITIEPETLAFASEGGTQEVAITTNIEYEASANADWLTIEKSEKGVNITATPNTKFEERTAEITISSEKYGISKTISVVQNGVSAESKNAILYTSSDGKIVTPYKSDVFGANIESNTYRDGQGIIIFDAPVTLIGDWAFHGCESLTSVTIPDSVTSIESSVFEGCSSLTSVTIPNSVTSIGQYAFCYCNGLTSITIPDSATSIGDYAFGECSSLTTVTIPDSVTTIYSGAFACCTSLKAFYGKFASEDNRCLIVDGILNAFAPAGLTEYTIPDSVTSIGEEAFAYCSSLTSITIPDSVTRIGSGAFGYTSLTSVIIPNSVTSIGNNAFQNCRGLTSITIPDSVTEIEGQAFCQCTSLTSVAIGNSVTSIGYAAFRDCTSLTSITIPDSVTSIGRSAFSGCTSLKRVTIGNSVTSIGDYAFGDCSSLTSITIPNSVTSIGGSAFSGCTGELIIDSNALGLYGGQFTKVVIGDSVTKIRYYAFYECTSLTSVTIPNSVTEIGSYAFAYCSSLKYVYCKPTTPPAGDYTMFYKNASWRKIYVPTASVDAYKVADGWSEYASSIVGYDF